VRLENLKSDSLPSNVEWREGTLPTSHSPPENEAHLPLALPASPDLIRHKVLCGQTERIVNRRPSNQPAKRSSQSTPATASGLMSWF
jgi:hypothetical protein